MRTRREASKRKQSKSIKWKISTTKKWNNENARACVGITFYFVKEKLEHCYLASFERIIESVNTVATANMDAQNKPWYALPFIHTIYISFALYCLLVNYQMHSQHQPTNGPPYSFWLILIKRKECVWVYFDNWNFVSSRTQNTRSKFRFSRFKWIMFIS